jgi:hypothetical protein
MTQDILPLVSCASIIDGPSLRTLFGLGWTLGRGEGPQRQTERKSQPYTYAVIPDITPFKSDTVRKVLQNFEANSKQQTPECIVDPPPAHRNHEIR